MTFGITPVTVNTGDLPAAPAGDPGFTVNSTGGGEPQPYPPMDFAGFLLFLQDSVSLGDDQVLVVNFVAPLVATRGVGEHENVITVTLQPAPETHDHMAFGAPLVLEGTLVDIPALFFTSILYPFLVSDAMSFGTDAERGSLLKIGIDLMQFAVPAPSAGTLVVVVVTYDGRPHPDLMQFAVPVPSAGTLVTVVVTYDGRPHPDTMQFAVPSPSAGTLVRVVIVYDNSLLHPDTMQYAVPTILSGTLT